jgi:hypothetical protein
MPPDAQKCAHHHFSRGNDVSMAAPMLNDDDTVIVRSTKFPEWLISATERGVGTQAIQADPYNRADALQDGDRQ